MMSHLLMKRPRRDRPATAPVATSGHVSGYVSGLQRHMLQMAHTWQQPPNTLHLTQAETQHSRYLSSFSLTQEG